MVRKCQTSEVFEDCNELSISTCQWIFWQIIYAIGFSAMQKSHWKVLFCCQDKPYGSKATLSKDYVTSCLFLTFAGSLNSKCNK